MAKYIAFCAAFKEYIKILALWGCILLMSLSAVFYVSLLASANDFLNQVKQQKTLIGLDIEKIHDNYFNQLVFIKSMFEESGLNEKEIDSFFKSKTVNILDRQNVGTIILTDKNFHIIYADNFSAAEYSKLNLYNRDYKKKIREMPNQIIFGNAVLGILTKKLSIPIVAGIKDKWGKFAGSIIFSVTLEKLTKDLGKGYTEQNFLKEISFISKEDANIIPDNYSKLINNPKSFFLLEILLAPASEYKFIFQNILTDNLISLTYDINKIKNLFLIKHFLLYAAILIILFVIIAIIFNYYVFIPLLPAILATEKYDGNIPNMLKAKNVFSRIGELASVYNALKEKDIAIKQQKDRIHGLMACCNFIAHQIYNKAAMLSEDIEDILLNNDNYNELQNWYQRTLEDIYKVSLDNKDKIQEAVKIISYTIKELSVIHKERIHIIDELIKLGIRPSLIKEKVLYQNMDSKLPTEKFTGVFFRNLLINSFQSVLTYIEQDNELLQVIAVEEYDEFQVHFIYRERDKMLQQHKELNLIRCQAWALVNGALLTMHYTQNFASVSFHFPKTY